MPPSLVTDPGLTVTTFPTQAVAVATVLDSPTVWTTQAHLYCDTLTLAVNAIDSAELTYEIGEGVIQPGQATFATYTPLALKGKFVRVTIVTTDEAGDPSNIVWIGYVVNDNVQRDGVKDIGGGVTRLVGRKQTIQAVGLEYFLARHQIDSAIVRRTGVTPNYTRIQRALTFNGGAASWRDDSQERPNRSTVVNQDGVYDFTDNPEAASLWRAQDIIDNLLLYHTMQNSGGDPSPADYQLNPADVTNLAGYYPVLASENITVFEALNQIIRPQRGLVWWTEYQEIVSPKVLIRVGTMATASISLPGGGTLPANSNQETLDFDTELDVAQCNLKRVGSRDYHQVKARGSRMTSTCTVGCGDNTIISDWSLLTGATDPGTEKKYKEAAKGDADYVGLSPEGKQKRNDAMRASDEFYRVYQAFRIPSAWDGKTGDGGNGTRNWTFPELSPTGSITGSLAWSVAGLRMLNTLRLKRGWDYSNPNAIKRATPATTPGELQPPFALLKVATSPDRYQFVDKLRRPDFSVGSPISPAITTGYDMAMQQTVPGLRLKASGGMQHALAFGTWTVGTAPEPSEQEPEVDYRSLRATVCLEADAFCEGKYPTVGLPAATPLEILTIDMGDKYRLDFLSQNTVVGLNKGQLVLTNQAKALRDDRAYLQDVARMAYEWYQVDRQSLTVTFRQVRNLFELGMLITAMGSSTTEEALNTVVSSITYDMKNGLTTVETDDNTLDVRSMG